MAGATGGNPMWGLKELPLPAPVSWTPETWGWLVVAGLFLAFLAWIGLRQLNAYRAQSYRRTAIADLDAMQRDRHKITALPALLRRTALVAFPRDEVAVLSGEAWVQWLNAAGADFLTGDADWLDRLAYQPRLSEELETESADRLLQGSRLFVRNHRARV